MILALEHLECYRLAVGTKARIKVHFTGIPSFRESLGAAAARAGRIT
jgi:hypothetical protein